MMSGKMRALPARDVDGLLALLVNNLTTEARLIAELRRGVLDYAHNHLDRVGDGEHYATTEVLSGEVLNSKSKGTYQERAKAVNILLDMIKFSSASQVFEFVKTQSFKQLSGEAGFFQINIFRQHLSTPIEKFIAGYNNFLKLRLNRHLAALLGDAKLVARFSDEMLAKLFWSYDSDQVANFIVNICGNRQFRSAWRPNCELSYEFMQRFLLRDQDIMEIYNAERVAYRADIILPSESMAPGKNALLDENLTQEELYQYEEESIFAIENWFYRTFSDLLINNICDDKGQKASLNANVPYHFYLLSTAAYMIVDPCSVGSFKDRFDKFSRDCRSLVSSIYASRYSKPVIICGFINVDGNHYVPYFIHAALHGKVSVLTVDPSPRIYSDAALATGAGCDDSKVRCREKLRNAFLSIFPDGDYQDADVTQMLRERDCGPNTATTLYDAFRGARTNEPLLQIDAGGRLLVDVRRLSIRSTYIGVDAYTGKFLYPLQLHKDSLLSRAFWRDILIETDSAYPMTTRHQLNDCAPLAVSDLYITSEQPLIAYSFQDAVSKQQVHDMRDVSISAIKSLILSVKQGVVIKNKMVKYFQKELRLPGPGLLVDFIQAKYSKEEMITLLQAHGSVESLCKDVILMLIREHVPQTLVDLFRKECRRHDAELTGFDLDDFVEKFVEDNAFVWCYLSAYQAGEVKRRLMADLTEIINGKLFDEYTAVLGEHLRAHVFNVLCALSVATFGDLAEHVIIFYQNNYPQMCPAIQFMAAHYRDKLKQMIQVETNLVIRKTVSQAQTFFDAWFAKNILHLHEMLSFFTVDVMQFRHWGFDELRMYGARDMRFVLDEKQLMSFMGIQVLEAVNATLEKLAAQHLKAFCDNSAREFFSDVRVKSALMQNQNIESLTLLVFQDVNNILRADQRIDINGLVARFGSSKSIQLNDLMHPMVNRYLHDSIYLAVHQFYQEQLDRCYDEFAVSLISQSQQFLVYQSFNLDKFTETARRLFSGVSRLPEPLCTHFMVWLNRRPAYNLNESYDQLTQLRRVSAELMRIADLLSHHMDQDDLLMMNRLQVFTKRIDGTNLFHNFQENFNVLQRELNALLRSLFARLVGHKNFLCGDNHSRGYTAEVRPFVLQMMGIHTSPVLTRVELIKHDKLAMARQANIEGLFWRQVLPQSTLIFLPKVRSLPDTYQKPLTRSIVLKILSYWYMHDKSARDPAIISHLVKMLNQDQINNVFSDIALHDLRARLVSHRTPEYMNALYASEDLLDQVRLALLKSTSLMQSTSSRIQFSALVKLFNLPCDISPMTPQVGRIGAPSLMVSQVEPRLVLRKNGIFNSTLFAESTSHVEDMLLGLRRKYAPRHDFLLDDDDIAMLASLLAKHWRALCHSHGDPDAAFYYYLYKSTRIDKVYIALAEILAAHYRERKMNVYTVTLLMPKYKRFAGLNHLVTQQLAPSMAMELGICIADSNADDISMRDLIVTRSGYVLNFISILTNYIRNNELTNPYTNQIFTDEDMADIASNFRFPELIKAISANRVTTLTPRCINYLVDYLNKAVFEDGFLRDYDHDQNQVAFKAYYEFNERLLRLPARERQALLDERIPGEQSETVQTIFRDSEDRCLTLRAVSLARVVMAYLGDRHGIRSAELVSRAHLIKIPVRSFNDAAIQAATKLKTAEDRALVLAENANNQRRFRF